MLQGSLLVVSFLLYPVPVSTIKERPKVKNYEVVYPIRLHPLHKREAKEPEQQEPFETVLKYKMTVNGKVAILYLKKNNNLLAPGYTETYYNSSGKEITTSPQIMDDCYYQGHIMNERVSDASISTCRGLRGYFSQGEEKYFIEPLSATSQDDQEHALFRDDPSEDQANSSCGVDDTLWSHGSHHNMVPPATRLVKLDDGKVHKPKKYIEYYVVLDNGEFKKYNENLAEIRKRVLEMANHVNMLYRKLDAHVALVGMEIWTDKDKINITGNANTTLENFSKWRGRDLLRRKQHDIAQLISSTDFTGATVGLAFMSSMCSPYHSVGIVQDYSNYHLRVAGTMAHEMGHNLGMVHDNANCKCPSEVCVMEQSLRYHMPTDFSSCSHVNYGKFLEEKLSNCLFNVPLPTDIISIPTCGNQLVEMGEDCDCGTPEECTDPCCDAKTCKVRAGFQCALGECCEKCHLKKAGMVCRTAKNECDLPEMCDGKSSLCPDDRFRVNGFPCQYGRGYCLMGTCPTLQQQCSEMWGPETKVANQSCYQQNGGGSKYGYCHIVNGTHVPCKAKDIMCGKLFCEGGSKSLRWAGLTISFMTCKIFDPEDSSQGIDMVANGTKCGKNKVCINAECVDIERAYKSTNCSSKCKGHAVCDHKLQCQCKEGWAPPDCEDSATVFHFSIVVGVLFPLAVIFVVLAIVLRHHSASSKQRKVQRPPSTTNAKPQKQKLNPWKVKAIQPQEMNQLITKPNFPPPPIPVSLELGEDKSGGWGDYNFKLPETSQLPAEANMLWVLLSVLWLTIPTQATSIKPVHELELQEIVHPKKLPAENNQTERHAEEERYAPEVQYQIILNGEEIILHLQKVKRLLRPDHSETPRGEDIARNSWNMKHCYYEGHILNEQDSIASIRTCDGLRGCFTHHGQGYLIKPVQSTEEGEHAVLRCNQKDADPASPQCAQRCVGRKQSHIRTSRSLKSLKQEDFLHGQKYIDLFVVLDNAFYKIYKGNVTLMRSFVFEVLNLLNVIYNTIDIQVALVGMEIWSDGDKIKVDPSIATTYHNFLKWHRANLGKNKIHDHAQLLSGIDFRNGRVGMAASNSLCSLSSVSVIGAKKNNVSLVGVMSHELGHVLGMGDVPYFTKCPSGSCVMNQYLSSKFPKDFSTKSLSHYQRYLLSRKPNCLLQAPVPKNIITEPRCGNKLLEVGEDCDCGSPKVCTNICCEPLTCKLRPGTDCSRGEASNHITN